MSPERVFDSVASRVYQDNPAWWPYGLKRNMLDGGGWLVKDSQQRPVGFVGLQIRPHQGQRVGYYAVGMLPEYRGRGLAKAALQQMLAKNAHRFDSARAMIVEGNEASQQLARRLGVAVDTMQKVAMVKEAMMGKILRSPLARTAAAAFGTDAAITGARAASTDTSFWDAYKDVNGLRAVMALSNLALARPAFGAKGRKPTVDWKQLSLLPAKDLTLSAVSLAHPIGGALKAYKEQSANVANPISNFVQQHPLLAWSIPLGLGGIGIANMLRARAEDKATATGENAQQQGRLRVTLPTRNPGDAETTVELPMDALQLSDTLRSKLHRDTRRRLRSEVSSRTYQQSLRPDNAESVL